MKCLHVKRVHIGRFTTKTSLVASSSSLTYIVKKKIVHHKQWNKMDNMSTVHSLPCVFLKHVIAWRYGLGQSGPSVRLDNTSSNRRLWLDKGKGPFSWSIPDLLPAPPSVKTLHRPPVRRGNFQYFDSNVNKIYEKNPKNNPI